MHPHPACTPSLPYRRRAGNAAQLCPSNRLLYAGVPRPSKFDLFPIVLYIYS